MRTPILLLAGLLALTVPLTPVQACTADDPVGCVQPTIDRVEEACGGSIGTCDDVVLEPIREALDNLCEGEPCANYLLERLCNGQVAPCLYQALCDGPTLSYCTAPVNALVADVLADHCQGNVNQCDDEAVEDAQSVQRIVDADLDEVPDALESEVCGRAALRDAVNANAPYLGACPTATDYTPPSSAPYLALVLAVAGFVLETVDAAADEAVETVTGLADYALWLAGYVGDLALEAAGDHDHDGVPDDREALVCGIENQNSGLDGSCADGDYDGPVL